jgi:hypothetical protein
MRYKFFISILFLLATVPIFAQPGSPGGQPDKKLIRIVDTMTQQEKTSRNPVILRSELDSLIKQYNASQVKEPVQEPVKDTVDKTSPEIFAGLGIIVLLLVWLLYQVYSHRKKFNRTVAVFSRQLRYKEIYSDPKIPSFGRTGSGSPTTKEITDMAKEKMAKGKLPSAMLENKISTMNDELQKLKKENESLNRVLKEYNGIQHEYDSLKTGFSKAFKIKNYPGYEKTKGETILLQGVLNTESSVANYAYEKFLKPILAIADANKNSPAKISEEDRVKVLDLLISLSLLYIEYLYLRVNDLSIGGKMVERINGFQKGNGLDPALLKELNMEHGSRALVLRMILDKSELHQLSYPVFDETNLNAQ